MVDETASVATTTTSEVASVKPAAVKKPAKAKNSKPKPDHPSTADMVNAAIKALAERNGSSLQAIKKYVGANYKVDAEKHAIFIRRYLKTAVTAGTLVQTKGKGASGSFKLAVKKTEVKAKPKVKAASKETSPKKAAVKKPVKKSETKAKGKKEASPKKVVKKAEVEKAVKPKADKVVKAKSPSKAKKATKGPTTKPKAPKPKIATASKAKSATKKTVAQKK